VPVVRPGVPAIAAAEPLAASAATRLVGREAANH
jgi:hypothetical protein